jgi:hypothetical protein
MKISIFSDITPCSPLKVNEVWEEYVACIFRSACYLLRAGFLLSLFFDPEDEGDFLPKRRLTFNGLHGVIPEDKTFQFFYYPSMCAFLSSVWIM